MHMVETYRVVVFTPERSVEKILRAVTKLCDLRYGNYMGVSWTSAAGVERFTPLADALPTLGVSGEETLADVVRVEFSLPRDPELLEQVVETAIYPNHAWEEPVVSVIETIESRKRS